MIVPFLSPFPSSPYLPGCSLLLSSTLHNPIGIKVQLPLITLFIITNTAYPAFILPASPIHIIHHLQPIHSNISVSSRCIIFFYISHQHFKDSPSLSLSLSLIIISGSTKCWCFFFWRICSQVSHLVFFCLCQILDSVSLFSVALSLSVSVSVSYTHTKMFLVGFLVCFFFFASLYYFSWSIG